MGKTSIEWTDASWNPIVGCTEVSPGCANCYAARLAGSRLRNVPAYEGLSQRIRYCAEHNRPLDDGRCLECRDSNGKTFILDMQSIVLGQQPRWTGEVRLLPDRLHEPLHWREPRKIFVCDMSDLFHESVPDEFIDRVFAVMAIAQKHTFQILTKRPERMREYLNYHSRDVRVSLAVYRISPYVDHNVPGDIVQVIEDRMQKALPNVWIGVSVENQHFADERIPALLATPAAVRFISAEPLLGDVNIGIWRWRKPGLDWVIAGGESGPHVRPMHPDWARSLRDQCQAAGVPFFFKQWGEWSFDQKFYQKLPASRVRYFEPNVIHPNGDRDCLMYRVGKKKAGRLLDGREWNEFPAPTS